MAPSDLASPPPAIPDEILKISYPAPHVLHVAMNRPNKYNAMSRELELTMDEVFDWFEAEPSLYVAILGSTNRKAWCAGADLSAMSERKKTQTSARPPQRGKNSFGGIACRTTKKPIIGAINGYAMGGGAEMVVNLDLAIAGQGAIFGFPEVKRGVTVGAGGIPRLVRMVGHTKAVELVLTGRNIPAQEALQLGMVNAVVPDDQVDSKALELAKTIAAGSPDSIIVLMQAIRLTQEVGSSNQAFAMNEGSAEFKKLWEGENCQIGLQAFKERKQPKFVPSKL